MKTESQSNEPTAASGVASSDMLDVTLSIELDIVEEGTADLVISDKGFYCSTTITVRQAQELANLLQRFVDSNCEGKSPELHDSELAAKRVAVDQWNAGQKAIEAAEKMKQYAEELFSS